MPAYILRDIDLDLWTRAKARAEKENHKSMKRVIFALLELYADGKISVTTTAHVTNHKR